MSRRLWSLLAVLALLFVGAAFIHFHYSRRPATSASPPNPVADASYLAVAFPKGLVADSNGNIYVNEEGRNRILRISATRRVTIVAGNGRMGFSGDGGPADQASLASPASIALDPAGDLFIADAGNNRIRRVDAKTHTITTIPGNSFKGEWNGEIGKYTDVSPGSYPPISIAVDSDENLYLGGPDGIGIRRVDAITHTVTKIVGSGLPGDPLATVPAVGAFKLVIDDQGSLLFSDPHQNAVSLINIPGSDVRRIAGSAVCGFAGDGGPATGALLCFPEALAVGRDNKLFIADTGNNRIRQVDLDTGVITTAAGNGQTGYAGDGGPAVNASLNRPMGTTVDGKGDVYIADTGNNCIRVLDAKTGAITTWVTGRDLELPSSAQAGGRER